MLLPLLFAVYIWLISHKPSSVRELLTTCYVVYVCDEFSADWSLHELTAASIESHPGIQSRHVVQGYSSGSVGAHVRCKLLKADARGGSQQEVAHTTNARWLNE